MLMAMLYNILIISLICVSKIITIKAKKPFIFREIVAELAKESELAADYDMDSNEISIKKKYQPYIKNVEKVISNLQRYYAANKQFIETFNGKQLISKNALAKMMNVSCPTIDKWFELGFISPFLFPGLHLDCFQIDEVIEQLRKQKK